MTNKYIREQYEVPAKVGGRVAYTGGGGKCVEGKITGTYGPWLRIRLDGEKRSQNFHPTWCIEYQNAL